MKFSLIHPSRGRPVKALAAFSEWMHNASGKHNYEYILSIDINDPEAEKYKSLFKEFPMLLLIGENRSLIDAVNAGAKRSSGECLIVISDDFGCPKDWDTELEKLPSSTFATSYFAIHINDTITSREAGVMTLPIVSRAVYENLGHIYNPIYFSMFADNELHDVCKLNGWLIYSDLVFPHRHFVNPDPALRSPRDATYDRQNDIEVYKMGEKIYNQRKAAGFPR